MATISPADSHVMEKASFWLSESFDPATRAEVQQMIDHDPVALTDSFYKDLEFGTGGLRGIMGAGTNKMNIYTVGMATQGLANYVLKANPGIVCRVAIAHDSRNNSRLFAETVAAVLSANGIEVYLFEELRPTPELSFTVRELKCQAGIVLTASHNPKEYNGYKVYWNDGGQLIDPHDNNTIAEVRKIDSPAKVKFEGNKDLIHSIGKEIDEVYWNRIAALRLSDEGKDLLSVVYTPIHGTGINGVPQVLAKMGFTKVHVLESQARPDGNFPTVHSPNPEEAAALDLAIQKAEEIHADLVLGTDPDADRVGIAVKGKDGRMQLLNGNETAAILVYYVLSRNRELGRLKGNEYIAKTIVTTNLLSEIANAFHVKYYECLTGFKYIAEMIREKEGKETYLVGGEESYGYLTGEFVRDKDAVSSAALICEAAAWAKSRGLTLLDYLRNIHQELGVYKEALVSITKKGKSGAEEIQEMMADFRKNTPETINGNKVILTHDYQLGLTRDLVTGETSVITLPKSNVFQFELADKTIITARPSGTEPKIKFYIGVCGEAGNDYEASRKKLDEKIEGIKAALGLND